MPSPLPFDAERDLLLERTVDVPPDRVFAAWTRPELLVRWFTPAPWTTAACDLDLRPGGVFRTVMRSPEGQEFENTACVLEVMPGERFVWTTALRPGFRPLTAAEQAAAPFTLSCVVAVAPAEGGGTHYTAHLRHADAEARDRHGDVGFQSGWGQALDQLVALVRDGLPT